MATTLAAQLAAVASLKPPEQPYTRGKPSLLFDFQKAADVSAETLLGIAQAGIQALCRADKRFAPFADSLFSRASLSVSREQLTRAEGAALDEQLGALLRVLANHFLSPAAFQVLEYCIRRYKIHVYNVADVFTCALPYHSTPEFARLLALLQLKATPWEWLRGAQETGAPPPRAAIVARCVNDPAVLREVCRSAQALGVQGFVSKTYLSFYAVLCCEVLGALPQLDEDLLTLLLPFLAAGLGATAAPEYRAATLMLLTQLLGRAQLAHEFLDVVALDVSRIWAELGGTTALMLLAHLAASQPHFKELPHKCLQMLTNQKDTVALLAQLQARHAKLDPLLRLLVAGLARVLPRAPQLGALTCDLMHSLDVESDLAHSFAQQLLRDGAALGARRADPESGIGIAQALVAQQQLQHVLRVMDLRYPDQLDAAINDVLQELSAAAAADGGSRKRSKHAKRHDAADGGASSVTDALIEFVQQAFSGSRHELLAPPTPDGGDGDSAAQQQQHQAALTLSLAVSAPASEMRALALKKLDAICASADSDSDGPAGVDAEELAATRQLLHSSLLTCLRDDVFAVAAAAAGARGLAGVPGEQQLPALAALLANATRALAGREPAAAEPGARGSRPSGKAAMAAAKAALAAVVAVGERAAAAASADSQASEAAASLQREAAALVLEHALADKRLKRLARAAIAAGAGGAAWSALLAPLASPAVAAALDGAAAAAGASQPSQPSQAEPDAVGSSSKRHKKGSKKAAAAAASQQDAPSAPADKDKHTDALSLNQALVAALADGLASDGAAGAPAGSVLLHEAAAVLPSCGPRCRHLLLLALSRAAGDAAQQDAAGAAAPTPAKGKAKAAKARAHRQSSTQLGAEPAGPASAASIAVVLVRMLEQQARPARGSKAKHGAGLALPADWAAEAAQLVDDRFSPSKMHLQQLHSQLQSMTDVLLLAGLHRALAAAPAASLAAQLGQPVQLFARLAQATAAARPPSAGLQDHLRLLLERSGQTPAQQLAFLAGIFGLPTGVAGEAAQAAALQLLAGPCAAVAAAEPASSGAWLVQLLAAADSSSTTVRGAACDALLALPGAGLPGVLDAAPLAELVAGLQQHAALIKGSAGAVAQLLCSALSGAAAMEVDRTPAAGTASKGRAGRSSKSGSRARSASQTGEAQQQAPGGELQLSSACCQALQELLVTVLPQLHGEAELAAARLAVAVLLASGGAPDAAAAAQQLLQQVLAALVSHAAAPAASARGGTAAPAWQQLAAMAGDGALAGAAEQLQQLRVAVAASLVQLYGPEALHAAPAVAAGWVSLLLLPFDPLAAAALAGPASGGEQDGAVQLSDAQLAAVAPVRAAALVQLSPACFAALLPEQQQAAFAAALRAYAADGDIGCRAAARQCLEQLPVTAPMLLVLLQGVGSAAVEQPGSEQPAPRAKRSRRASQEPEAAAAGSQSAGGAAPPDVTPAALDAAIAALELLQWKDEVAERELLLQPLQDLLRCIIPHMGSIAEAYEDQEDREDQEEQPQPQPQPEAAAAAAAAVSPSAAGYAAQLCLLTLEQLAAGSDAAARSVDGQLVLAAASAAPDGAVRNAALSLLGVLARQSPEDVLALVLKGLHIIQHSAALQADAHSRAVAAGTLAALVPAWLAAGRGSEELWASLIEALPSLPAARRLGLLEPLLGALPEDQGLRVGLLLLLRRLLAATSQSSKLAPEQPTPPGGKAAKRAKAAKQQQQPEAAAEPAPAAAGSQPEDGWLPDIMAGLCEKVPVPQRLAAFAAVLEASLAHDGQALPAHEALPRLAVSFVAANLKARSIASATAAARAPDGSRAVRAALQESCKALMAQALLHLLQLNAAGGEGDQAAAAAAVAAGRRGGRSGRRLHKAVAAAASGVYALLAALEGVQDCPSYLLALVEMCRQPADAVQRRALKLLAARLLKARVDLVELELLPPDERPAAQTELAEAGLAVCAELPRLLAAAPAITRQLALLAADAGMRVFGSLLPSVVLASLLVVVGTVHDPSAPVRVSALAAIAAGTAAIGTQLVPLLPQTTSAVLSAAQDAARGLAAAVAGEDPAPQQGADDVERQQAASDDSDDETLAQPASRAEEAGLQLAGALAALEALVAGLGPFLSPYLKQLLQLLLHGQVLACDVAGASAAAARLRAALPAKLPPRLLLEPLVSQWDYALAACGSRPPRGERAEASAADADAAPAVALLEVAASLAASMEPAVAATYHEQLLQLLLPALDTRHRWLLAVGGASTAQQRSAAAAAAAAAAAGGESHAAAAAAALARFSADDVAAVEAAATRALVALVMKLSESRFKPLFLRLLEWTNAAAAAAAGDGGGSAGGGGDRGGVGRAATLLGVACALGHRLRGVFAPYTKYFSVLLMKVLAGEALAPGQRPKKRRKSQAQHPAPDAGGPAAPPGADALLVSAWLARLRAVRVVHLLALHEPAPATPAAQGEQQERFDRLLPLLVEVLAGEPPPAGLLPLLARQGADAALDLPGAPHAALGEAGKAVAEAGAPAAAAAACDVLGAAALGALQQLAVAGGSDMAWKPLHHALLMATRGGNERAKLLALGGVSRLAELLREEYLMLLPEALPFAAELMEDGALPVEAAAQGLVAQLEALSGEKLDSYLKA